MPSRRDPGANVTAAARSVNARPTRGRHREWALIAPAHPRLRSITASEARPTIIGPWMTSQSAG